MKFTKYDNTYQYTLEFVKKSFNYRCSFYRLTKYRYSRIVDDLISIDLYANDNKSLQLLEAKRFNKKQFEYYKTNIDNLIAQINRTRTSTRNIQGPRGQEVRNFTLKPVQTFLRSFIVPVAG